MPFYERQPYITPLYQVLLELLRGEIRVPRFQRPGTEIVWTTDQRRDLLDSLYRGFPVGTILLWSTTTPIKCLDRVAGFPLVNPSERTPFRLLLDGHQRLSTLLAILGPGLRRELPGSILEPDDVLDETWVFETRASRDDSPESFRARFTTLKKGSLPSPTQVPLRKCLDRVEMNRWVRESSLSEEQVRAAESVRDKLREYSIPVAVLAADSLEEAAESFKRVNSSGTPMGTFHMVSALAFSQTFDLDETFGELKREHLEPVGWAELDNTDALRVCAGLTDVHPTKLKVEHLSKRLRENVELSIEAFQALARASGLLKSVGIHGPKALPYAWQLITLAVLLGKGKRHALTPEETRGVEAWFWVTTYGEVFAGVTATYDRAYRSLEAMLKGDGWEQTEMHRDVTRHVEEVKRFDFRAVRSKALALLLARVYDKGDPAGEAHQSLAAKGAEALTTLRSHSPRSSWCELVVTCRSGELQQVRSLLRSGQLELNSGDLARFGFPVDTLVGDVDEAIQARRRHLLALETEFVQKFGLAWRS